METQTNIEQTTGRETGSITVDMKHLQKTFGGNHVLTDATLQVKKGENLVVMGKSGTGKSVLIKCIVKLIDADAGELKLFGQDVMRADEKDMSAVRSRIGFLFQSGALYDSMTVWENLAFPILRREKIADAELDKRIDEVLTNVGLKDTGTKMPSELSGGQRKRISLARTLITNPELMLYDEPTTGLDPITSGEISELILAMQKKYKPASIIITHDVKCAKITADRIMILHEGKFIAEGTYDELEKSEDKIVNAFFK